MLGLCGVRRGRTETAASWPKNYVAIGTQRSLRNESSALLILPPRLLDFSYNDLYVEKVTSLHCGCGADAL
jgi:hypothetical protein